MFKLSRLFSKKKRTSRKQESFTSLRRAPTPVSQLRLGMYVVELDRPWIETPVMFQGFEIVSEREIKTLKEYCSFVYIDVEKQKNRKLQHQGSQKRKVSQTEKNRDIPQFNSLDSYHHLVIGKPPIKLSSFEHQIEQAELTYKETGVLIADAMKRVSEGKSVDGQQAEEAITLCVNRALHSPDALLWFSQLKKKDEYTAQHGLNVSILSIILGRHINLSVAELTKVGVCGLMHDIGKMMLPLEILNKTSALTAEEQKIMKSHTTLGYEVLASSHKMIPEAVMTALDHHERVDGTGYSRHIDKSELSFYTTIVTIADMYDAMTSDKIYRKALSHLDATKIMLALADKHLDRELVIKFIESIGVYPSGSFVEMTDGYIAIVVESNEHTRLRPKVMLILDGEKQPSTEKILDLAGMPEDSKGNLISIKSIIKASDYQIDGTKYHQNEVLQESFASLK